ncbi:MAG: hypothetical protein AAGI03_13285 [Pseudomonadota bacterium]
MTPSRANLYLGLGALLLALFAIFVWVPLDTDTGLLETVRRRTTIGDALAPTIALSVIALGGLLLLFEKRAPDQPALSPAHLSYAGGFLALLLVAVFAMRWSGPLAAGLLSDVPDYRLLRDTAPWKWIGFAAGGVILVTGSISLIERRLSLRALLVGLGIVLALIAIFDLPFDDLLLPPNGDV